MPITHVSVNTAAHSREFFEPSDEDIDNCLNVLVEDLSNQVEEIDETVFSVTWWSTLDELITDVEDED